MYRIVYKKELNPSVIRIDIEAPYVAKAAKAGQFIILRVDKDGERIPLTVADTDPERGTVTVIYQVVGATTKKLSYLGEGDYICDFVGPLGMPTELDGIADACIVGGGVGCAIALPIAKELKRRGAKVTTIIGFRSSELVILEDEFRAVSDEMHIVTDDGSYGRQGNVCMPLGELFDSGRRFDKVITIGPLVMMKFVVNLTRPTGIPCTVSMNPIMIDGTGMCGGCRLTLVDGDKRITKFACVDGPDFDGYLVDFDEAMLRGTMYRDFEAHAYSDACNLFKSGVKNG